MFKGFAKSDDIMTGMQLLTLYLPPDVCITEIFPVSISQKKHRVP